MKRLVLVGAGHAHAEVLRVWAGAPLAGVELVLVSPHALAPYSGMVPGWLSGAYRFEEMAMDFAGLCSAAGARWVAGELDAVDAHRQQMRLTTGETLDWDLLSLNVGSTLNPPAAHPARATRMLSMRPLAALRLHYDALLAQWMKHDASQPFTVTAVGGGAAGFESLLAVLARLRALRPECTVHGGLVTRGTTLLPGLASAARRAALQALTRAGVTLQLGTPWCNTIARSSDLVLWATGAEAHAWQRDPMRRGALAVSDRGFIRIDAQLRSVSHANVFAVGDCAEWLTPLPKAGVHAVRMGPVLSHNLRAALGEGTAQNHRAPHRFLALLSTADGRAIASRGGLGGQGRWAWRWKDHIDRAFVKRYALRPLGPDAVGTPTSLSSSPSGDSA
ncbi:MAG: FAD-dependent oxidoreductase [Pseudomonadota bacterium]